MDPKFVSVVWDDAWADTHESVSQEDAHMKHKATLMETRGWLLVDNDVGVSVFNERCLDEGDGSFRGRTFVPRAMIRTVTIISSPRKPRKKPDPTPPAPS